MESIKLIDMKNSEMSGCIHVEVVTAFPPRTAGKHKVQDVVVKDDSAEMKMAIWNDQVNIGDKLTVTEAKSYLDTYKGTSEMKLKVGGKLIKPNGGSGGGNQKSFSKKSYNPPAVVTEKPLVDMTTEELKEVYPKTQGGQRGLFDKLFMHREQMGVLEKLNKTIEDLDVTISVSVESLESKLPSKKSGKK